MARIFTARARDGVIVADGLDLPEGAVVTVAAVERDEPEIELGPDELAELDAALAEADRSDAVPSDDVLAELDAIRPGSE